MASSRASFLALVLKIVIGLQVLACLSSTCFLAIAISLSEIPKFEKVPEFDNSVLAQHQRNHQKHFNSMPVDEPYSSSPKTSQYLKVVPHPATYFQEEKPVYTRYDYAGVLLVLPIAQVINHTIDALHLVNRLNISDDQYLRKRAYFLNHKQESVTSKMVNLKNNIDAHVIPEEEFLQIVSQPQEPQEDQEYYMQRVRRRAEHVQPAFVPSFFSKVAMPILEFLGFNELQMANLLGLSAPDLARYRREINLNLDVGQAITSFWNGVTQIFYGTNIKETQRAVSNLAVKVEHLQDYVKEYSQKVTVLMEKLSTTMFSKINAAEKAQLAFMILDEAEESLDLLGAALTPILQGFIPSVVMDAASIVHIFKTVQEHVAAKGLTLGINNPNEIFTLKTTTYQRNGNWELLLSLPTMMLEDKMPGFKFINFPKIQNGIPLIWDVEEALFAASPMIYPNQISYIQIPRQQLAETCTEYENVFLCHTPIKHTPSCLSDLFHNKTSHCSAKRAEDIPTLVTTSKNLFFFFLNETRVLLDCPHHHQKVILKGLYTIEDKPHCKISTATFTYYMNGKHASQIFVKSVPRIISSNLLPDDPNHELFIEEESELEKDFEALKETVKNFNNTEPVEDLYGSYMPIIAVSLAAASLVILLGVGGFCLIRAYNVFK